MEEKGGEGEHRDCIHEFGQRATNERQDDGGGGDGGWGVSQQWGVHLYFRTLYFGRKMNSDNGLCMNS